MRFRKLRIGLVIVGTFALMAACGAAATIGVISFLMSLGLKYHDNYEYYSQTPAVLLIPIAAIGAFVAAGVTVWVLHKNQWRVSLRNLLFATTIIAVFLGLMVWATR